MKKSLLSKAIGLALVVCGTAAQAVVIDVVGGGGTGALVFDPITTAVGLPGSAVREVTGLDWKPDNAIAIGALSTPTLAAGGPSAAGQAGNESYLRNVAQGSLAGFSTTTGDLAVGFVGKEFTFVASFYTFTSGIGSGTVGNRLAPGESYFRVYADSAKDSNVITGAGYDNGTLILEGTLSALNGSFTDQTRRGLASPSLLDGFDENGTSVPGNTDNQKGVLSNVGNGSNTLTIDITTLDTSYFLGNAAVINQLLLTLNYNDTTNLATPFISTTPSDSVVGVVPSYSMVATGDPLNPFVKVNGADCTTGGLSEDGAFAPRCDFHFQSDASGSFIERPLPEPTSLALVGLAFAGAGFAARRRAKKA
jgi:hypothetical protein